MTRKYNVKHTRKRSNYPGRMSARGLSRAPKMLSLETLRARQTDKHGELYEEYGGTAVRG